MYSFFLLVFLILVIVTLCVTVVSTYFLLNAENLMAVERVRAQHR